ncbi:hypothetical protein EV182_008411, partial [Spiromyces aspiralis]
DSQPRYLVDAGRSVSQQASTHTLRTPATPVTRPSARDPLQKLRRSEHQQRRRHSYQPTAVTTAAVATTAYDDYDGHGDLPPAQYHTPSRKANKRLANVYLPNGDSSPSYIGGSVRLRRNASMLRNGLSDGDGGEDKLTVMKKKSMPTLK